MTSRTPQFGRRGGERRAADPQHQQHGHSFRMTSSTKEVILTSPRDRVLERRAGFIRATKG
jgi:hypothetical protein